MIKPTATKKPHLRPPPPSITPTLLDNTVDSIVSIFGTWVVFILHIIGFGLWIFYDWNIHLLTFWVSLEAILLSLLILMSQSRQKEFDQRHAMADFEIDRHAEKQTRILIEMLQEIGEKVGVKEFEVDTKTINAKEVE